MSILARSEFQAIEVALEGAAPLPSYHFLRAPECGLVMVRGRAGGTGEAVNLGEMSVTRCAVETADGRVGHAYVAGRDTRRAELAAVLDAALQDSARSVALERAVLAPLAAHLDAVREERSRKAAATKVGFFTMRNMRS